MTSGLEKKISFTISGYEIGFKPAFNSKKNNPKVGEIVVRKQNRVCWNTKTDNTLTF